MDDPVREAQLEEVYQILRASFMKTKRVHTVPGSTKIIDPSMNLRQVAATMYDTGLNADEKAYLRKFIAEHLEFYRTVVEISSHPTEGNRKLYELVKGLWEKLR